jgi:hypothetical protein
MEPQSDWMQALGRLRAHGMPYEQIAADIGASGRSVRRWDQRRVRVVQGGEAAPQREAAPIGAFARALVRIAGELP